MTPWHFLPLAIFYVAYGFISAIVMFIACLRCKEPRFEIWECFGYAIGTLIFWPIVNICTYIDADKKVEW